MTSVNVTTTKNTVTVNGETRVVTVKTQGPQGPSLPDGDKGDVTVSNNGTAISINNNAVTSAKIVDGAIVDADINASAAIALTKLATGALPTAITVTSANISDLSIVNADINASAAIAGTKISPDFGSQDITTSGHIDLPDASTIKLGDSDEFQIQHTASGASLISETGSGNLEIRATNINLKDSNANNKLATNSLGVAITGNLDVSNGADITGNITVTGTVDGRDVATDGTKLDGIETGATADQTASEIKTAYESNSDTNAFTDADHTKLDGIETAATADQTAAEIKTLLNSDGIVNAQIDASAAIAGTKISPNFGSQNITTTGDLGSESLTITSLAPIINFNDTDNSPDYRIVVQSGAFKVQHTTGGNTDRFVINTDGHIDITGNLDVGAGLDVTGNITVTGTVDGRDVATDGTKLDGIEANAINASNTAITNKLPLAGGTLTGNLTISRSNPRIIFTDTDNNPDYLIDVNAGHFLIFDATNNANKILINSDGHIDLLANVDITNGLDVTGDLTVSGNMTVSGTTTTIDTTTLTVEDKNIELGKVSTPTDTTADGGGITLKGATDKTFQWLDATDSWTSSEHIALPDSKRLKIGDSQDLQIYHISSQGSIINHFGANHLVLRSGNNIDLRSANDDSYFAKFVEDGAAEIYFDGSKKLETTSTGTKVIDSDTTTHLAVETSSGIAGYLWGGGNDQIAILTSQGDSEFALRGVKNAQTELYYDNSKKFETTTNGISVTGKIVATTNMLISGNNGGLFFGSSAFYGTFAAIGIASNDNFHVTGSEAGDLLIASKAGEHIVFGANTTGLTPTKRLRITRAGNIEIPTDSSSEFIGRLQIGAGQDLELYHNGSSSYIVNNTGDTHLIGAATDSLSKWLYIQAKSGEHSIICKDNAAVELYYDNSKKLETTSTGVSVTGGLTASGASTFNEDVTFTGDNANILFDKNNNNIRVFDGSSIDFGNSGDLKIHHSGHVNIIDDVQSKNISIQRGGVEQWKLGDGTFRGSDNKKIQLGNAQDLQIYHDGSNSFIDESTGTGSLYVRTNAFQIQKGAGSETMAQFLSDGAVNLYYDNSKKFETTSSGVSVTAQELSITDNNPFLKLNDSITTTASRLICANGQLHLQSGAQGSGGGTTSLGTVNISGFFGGEHYARFFGNAQVELYYDNAKKLQTTAYGVSIDNGKAKFEHSGGNTFLQNVTGGLLIQGNGTDNTFIRAKNGENSLVAVPDGTVELYHNNSKKLETTSTGVSVTGNITVSGTVDGRDLATDGTKLDGIESNATADQTASDIKTLFNSSGLVNAQIDASAAIAGSKISPTFTSNITISNIQPRLTFSDTNNNPDYFIDDNAGALRFYDATNGATRLQINGDGHVDIDGNLDVGAGIDVTGNITVSGTVDGVDVAALNTTVSGKLSNIVEDTSPQLGGALDTNNQNIEFGDVGNTSQNRLKFGASGDMSIFHDASSSKNFISTIGNNDCSITSRRVDIKSDDNSETIASFIKNGAVELYYDNSKKLETTSIGVSLTGRLGCDGLDMGDSETIRLGSSQDLQIFHSGTSGYISNGTGVLYTLSDTFEVRGSNANETHLKTVDNGAVELYYDNSKKFETTSTGATVTGSLGVSTHLMVDGATAGHNGSSLYVIGSYGNSNSQTCVKVDNSDGAQLLLLRSDRAFFSDSIYHSTTSSAANVHVDSNGIVRRSTSSKDYKKNIKDASWGLADVLKLRPVTFQNNAEGEFADDHTYGGFISEELHKSGLTEFVQYDENNKAEGISYGHMVALLTNAIKELSAEVAALKAA